MLQSVLTLIDVQVAFWRFDDKGLVSKYHAWIPNLEAWTMAATGIDYSNLVIQKAAPLALCPVIQDRCKGENEQYSDTAACVAELDLKPFGTFDEA